MNINIITRCVIDMPDKKGAITCYEQYEVIQMTIAGIKAYFKEQGIDAPRVAPTRFARNAMKIDIRDALRFVTNIRDYEIMKGKNDMEEIE